MLLILTDKIYQLDLDIYTHTYVIKIHCQGYKEKLHFFFIKNI